MPSSQLGSTHDRQRRAWHDIIALGEHTRSDDVGRGITSPPLDSTHGRTTSGMAFHHRLWAAQTIGRRQVWHAITSLEKHTRSNDVGRGMTSPPLDRIHGRQRRAWHDITALGQHTQSDGVGRGLTSSPLDSTHGRLRRAWHDITALGQHIWSAMSNVG